MASTNLTRVIEGLTDFFKNASLTHTKKHCSKNSKAKKELRNSKKCTANKKVHLRFYKEHKVLVLNSIENKTKKFNSSIKNTDSNKALKHRFDRTNYKPKVSLNS